MITIGLGLAYTTLNDAPMLDYFYDKLLTALSIYSRYVPQPFPRTDVSDCIHQFAVRERLMLDMDGVHDLLHERAVLIAKSTPSYHQLCIINRYSPRYHEYFFYIFMASGSLHRVNSSIQPGDNVLYHPRRS